MALKGQLKSFLAVIALAGAVALVVVQVVRVGQNTRTEAVLLSALQFLLSILFTWVIAEAAASEFFLERKKSVAVGAFRRIKELEQCLDRMEIYLRKSSKAESSGLQAVQACLENAQYTVQSSIGDWSDVIGDEIRITKEIERLRGYRSRLIGRSKGSLEDANAQAGVGVLEQKLDKLIRRLPPELQQIAVEQEEVQSDSFADCVETIAFLFERDHELILEAPCGNAGFEYRDDCTEVSEGDEMFLAHPSVSDDVLCVYHESGKNIGTVRDHCGGWNDKRFGQVMDVYLGKRPLPSALGGAPVRCTVSGITDRALDGRLYLRLSLKEPPSLRCATFIQDYHQSREVEWHDN